MSDADKKPLSAEELAAEGATALPDKEVVSLLDLNADIDLAIDAAAPIDLAIAANANVVAPIDAAVGANILSVDSTAQSLAAQNVLVNQDVTADAAAHATQDSSIDQGNDVIDDGTADGTSGDGGAIDGSTTTTQTEPTSVEGALGGDLLDVNVNVDADADVAAPVQGAVAANANVAAPIDAAVSANIGSIGSEATALAQQDVVINQNIDGSAEATADQASDIQQ